MVQAMRYPPEGIRGNGARRSRAPRAGTRWTTTSTRPTAQMVPAGAGRNRDRGEEPQSHRRDRGAWTACSSDRPTSLPAWATGASPATPRCRRSSSTASPPCAPPARPPASSPPIRLSRSSTSTRVRCSWAVGAGDTSLLVKAATETAQRFKGEAPARPVAPRRVLTRRAKCRPSRAPRNRLCRAASGRPLWGVTPQAAQGGSGQRRKQLHQPGGHHPPPPARPGSGPSAGSLR